jgi:hypothetical protein
MHRNCRLVGLLTGLALLVSLLVGCGESAPSTPVASAPTPTATSQPTETASPTPTPFFVDGKAYQRVTDSMFGFTFAIPTDTQQQQSQTEPNTGGDFNSWTSSNSDSSLALNITFGGDTKGLAANQCPGAISGPLISVVTVGQGITAYQINGFVSPTVPQGAASVPSISVSFVSNGVVVSIQLTPQTQGNLMARYGGIWQEMLASFQPGAFVNPTPPCGS